MDPFLQAMLDEGMPDTLTQQLCNQIFTYNKIPHKIFKKTPSKTTEGGKKTKTTSSSKTKTKTKKSAGFGWENDDNEKDTTSSSSDFPGVGPDEESYASVIQKALFTLATDPDTGKDNRKRLLLISEGLLHQKGEVILPFATEKQGNRRITKGGLRAKFVKKGLGVRTRNQRKVRQRDTTRQGKKGTKSKKAKKRS